MVVVIGCKHHVEGFVRGRRAQIKCRATTRIHTLLICRSDRACRDADEIASIPFTLRYPRKSLGTTPAR